MATRTPRELIELYWDRVYNEGEVELVRELCADPIIRHDPDYITPLSHDEQIERIERSLKARPFFTHEVLHADDRFVTSVWNMVSRAGREMKLCGIEVFEAQDGRFIRCWNSTYMKGFWGEDKDLFDPAALAPPALVAAASEISADWYQRALAAGKVASVQRLALEPEVTGIGHGTTSSVARIRAAYNSGHVTAPVFAICKIGQQRAEALAANSPAEREERAYALFGSDPAFRVPRVYFSARDESGLSNLLMEDVAQGGGHPGDQIAGCSIDEAGAVVRELARFHAAYWQDPAIRDLEWLMDPAALLPAYLKGAQVMREWLGTAVGEAALATIDRLGELAPRWLALPCERETLLHRDPRVDNVIFERTDNGVRACLIDWQCIGRGDPLYDVAYFLSGSVSVADRRADESDLLREYLDMIRATDPTFTEEMALAGYCRNLVSGLWLTVVAAAFTERNEHNARLLESLVERNVAAIADWDSLSALA